MSGWLALRTEAGSRRNDAAWSEALEAARGQSLQEWTAPDGRTFLAAWKRGSGEFRDSGLLHRSDGGRACVAWTGVCLEDAGETTGDALSILSAPGDPSARVAALNGEFAAAAVEGPTGALNLWTDRHRQYPVYVWRGKGVLAASTEMSCVIPFLGNPRLDTVSVDLFLRCGEFTGGRTPLEGVEVLPPASWTRVDDGSPLSRTYWRLRHRGDPGIGIDAASSEIAARLTSAVRRVEAAVPRLITPLSGGLDSRILLGLCRHPDQVPSVTWGAPGCRDLEYAEAFAARVKSPHRSLSFDPDAFVARWKDGVSATGGCFPVRDMFILPFAPGLAERADVALNGLAGDVLLGGNFLKASWLGSRNLPDLAAQTWRWRVPAEEEALTTGLMGDAVGPDSARELWIRSITSHGEGRPVEVLVDWLLENRVFRFTNCGTQLLRTALESYSPFFDRDLVDYFVRVPLELRLKHRLYFHAMAKASPPAAEIPWQRTAIPPRWGHPAALASLAWHRALRVLGKTLGFEPFPREKVASPADWFRGPWSAPVRAILFSERARSRKAVQPDALNRVWEAHQSGRDCSRALGALVALELFCLRFLDRLPNPGEGRPG